MFFIFKRNGAKDILQKHGLKYVLGISIIFQMYCAEPPNGIGIPFDDSDRILFAPHDGFDALSTASTPEAVSTSSAASAPVSNTLAGGIVITYAIPVCIHEISAANLSMNYAADIADAVSVHVHIST